MHKIKKTAYRASAALPLLLSADFAAASVTAQMPGPGVFALIALGVVGAVAVARSRS